MATAHDPKVDEKPWLKRQPPWPRRDGVFRFTVDQAYQLADLGFFDDRRVELIEGVFYEMTVNPPHAASSDLTAILLRELFPDLYLRISNPLDVGRRSLPEPDLALVHGSARDYARNHPKTSLLVIEISHATLRKDRTLKAHLYAYAGIADYWIVNLVDRQLEIRRNPGPDPARKGRFAYRDLTFVPADGHASPLAKPDARIAVADMLP